MRRHRDLGPCIVCAGLDEHDAEAHARHRRGRERTANLLDPRWPPLLGLPAYTAAEKATPGTGRSETPAAPRRLRHTVAPTPTFLASVGRPRGRKRQLLELPGTVQWRRLQGHLALEAPLRAARRPGR